MEIITAISITITFAYTATIAYYLYQWQSHKEFEPKQNESTQNIFISIIIPIKNQSNTLINCLESINNQNYNKENFEVIIVDDNSDEQIDFNQIQSKFQTLNIQFVKLQNHNLKGKKNAIIRAVEIAKGKLIITTDSDCTHSSKWLKTIVEFYTTYHHKFIAAPVITINQNNIFIQYFQHIEMAGLMIITAAAFFSKKPIMCSGANLIYEKQLFLELQPYNNNLHIPSGDDYFFMKAVSQKYPNDIMFLKNTNATVYTEPQYTYTSLLNQRIRWTKKNYNDTQSISFIIGIIVFLANFQIIILTIGSVLCYKIIPLLLLALIFKTFIDYRLLKTAANFFKTKFYSFPKLSIYNIIYVTLTTIISTCINPKWK